MQINVSHQLPALNEHLIELRQRLNGDLTPLMSGIGSLLENSTRDRFDTKTDPNGRPWKPLSAITLMRRNGRGGGILVDWGDLFHSISYHAERSSVQVGTDRHYGKYHQMGWGVPKRSFLGISQQDQADITDLINDFMAGSL